MKRARGFTLIESLIVIAVIGIVATVAVPSLTELLARRQLEGAAHELLSDLQFTRSAAVSGNANARLTTSSSGYTVTLGTQTLKAVTLPTSLAVTQPVTLTFEPRLGMPNGPTATVTLSSQRTTETVQARVDAMGRVLACAPSGRFTGFAAC